jgi:hypothetical protein
MCVAHCCGIRAAGTSPDLDRDGETRDGLPVIAHGTAELNSRRNQALRGYLLHSIVSAHECRITADIAIAIFLAIEGK